MPSTGKKNRPRFLPSVDFGRAVSQQVTAPQTGLFLLAGNGLCTLVTEHRVAQCRDSFGVARSRRGDLGEGAVLDRWARGLEQPGQRKAMGSREFQIALGVR